MVFADKLEDGEDTKKTAAEKSVKQTKANTVVLEDDSGDDSFCVVVGVKESPPCAVNTKQKVAYHPAVYCMLC